MSIFWVMCWWPMNYALNRYIFMLMFLCRVKNERLDFYSSDPIWFESLAIQLNYKRKIIIMRLCICDDDKHEFAFICSMVRFLSKCNFCRTFKQNKKLSLHLSDNQNCKHWGRCIHKYIFCMYAHNQRINIITRSQFSWLLDFLCVYISLDYNFFSWS